MTSVAAEPDALAPGRAAAEARRALQPAEIAWLAAVPCALLTIAAIVLLGPPLGRLLLTPGSEAFWPAIGVTPQPLEHGRFLVGLLGPPLLAAVVLAGSRGGVRERLRLRPAAIRALVATSQALAIAFVLVCVAAQNDVVLSADFVGWNHFRYFTPATLVVALALPLLALALLRRRTIGDLVARAARETRTRRGACIAVAALYTALWMLTAINLDSSIGNTTEAVSGHILWTMAEPFAVLDGRTPLVNFHAQYGQLWAYLAAAPMALLGATIGTYTIVMASTSGLVMLAIYTVLRRITRSSLLALALFLPFLATSFFTIRGPLENRWNVANLYMVWPIRYAGPFLLAWLTARHLDGATPRRAWPLFVAAGLVAINNPDFGLAATAATFAALACVQLARPRRELARLAGTAAAGLVAAVAGFSLFTLIRSGSLPRFSLLFEFARLYGIGGWQQDPMPEIGLHTVVLLTFGVALVVAAVRVARGSEEPLLTSMLAWCGTFGVIASVYYGGRAHPLALFDFLAPWALTLALLLTVVVRRLAAQRWRRPTAIELVVLFGFGLAVCSLPQTPTPWSQIARIRNRTPTPVFKQLSAERMIAASTRRGEKVAILTTLGHRIAYDLGLVNVSPYSSIESMATRQQLQRTIATLRAEHARKLYISLRFTFPGEVTAIAEAGFTEVRRDPTGDYVELIDESGAAG